MKKAILFVALAAFGAVPVTAQLVTSDAVAAIDNIPPAPVTDLQALLATEGNVRSVALTWTLSVDDARSFTTFGNQVVPTGDVRGYRVYRQHSEGVEGLIATLSPGISEFVDDVIRENYYDLDLIEHSTEAYDYKRGFCTLTADVVVSAQNLMNSSADLTGWTVSFKTDGGVLSFDA